jgi:ATP-dependent Clp protease ATP-binding subunit ClpC
MPYRRRGNLTERSYRVIELAEKSAAELKHASVGPTHLALGLLREGEGVAATALQFHGINLEALNAALTASLTDSARTETTLDPELSADADKALDQAAAEAAELGHSYVGTEHILLAMLRDSDGVAATTLARHGFTFAMARARILWILGATPEKQEPFVAPAAV